MRIAILLLSVALVGCINPAPPTRPNALDTSAKDAFLNAINAKRSSAQSITCDNPSGLNGYPTSQTYAQPVPAATWNPKLEAAALAHADHLVNIAYDFATDTRSPHVGVGDGDPLTRALARGYKGTTAAETIAFNQNTIAEVVDAWQTSTNSHCNVMLDKDLPEIGGALLNSQDGTKRYWVMVYGKPQ
jgi:uncharacterized protein YkwD